MKNKYRHSYALKISLVLVITTYTLLPSYAQDGASPPIKGRVTDAQGALAGVNIVIKGKNRGTISDLQGDYQVYAATTDTLVFTYIGYKTREVAVKGKTTLDIELEPDATALDQVVINAGYYKVSDREKTGSISRITATEIENQPVSNPLAAMQGRVPGLAISSTTGVPGGGFTVRIRGQSSIAAGNEPLFVIDGIPYDSQSLSSADVSAGVFPSGNVSPLSLINPNDIESVAILKDADATAIYGSRGANGVVLITTKEGKAGKTRLTLKASTGGSHITRPLKLLNTAQYLAMRREAFANDGITEYPETAYDVNGTWDINRETDWQKKLLGGTGNLRTLEAGISGGGAQTRFVLNGGYRHETTVFPGDARYSRISVHNKLTHDSKNKRLAMGVSMDYSYEDNRLPGSDFSLQAHTLPPNAPALYEENGELNWENSTFENPLSILNTAYSEKSNTLLGSLHLAYKLGRGFELSSGLGYNANWLSEFNTTPHTIYDPAYGLGPEYSSLYQSDSKRNSWIVEPQLSWEHRLGHGQLNIIIGGSYQQKTADMLTQFGAGFPSNSLIHNLAAASYLETTHDETTVYKYEAVYGRINYNWRHRYIINFTGRRDGSSRFGPGRRFADFGAVGAAWLFSEASFLKDSAWLSYGKLRGSYGSTGNDQIGDYGYLDTYTVTGTPYIGTIGISPTQLYNPNFGWEVNKKGEIALEGGVWDNRILFTAAWFRNRSDNQLVGIPLPGTTGFASVQANLKAVIENRGWEFSLHTDNIKKDYFTWSTDFNLTLPTNELLAFPNLQQSTYTNQYVIGQPITIKKLYHYTGVDPQTGVYQFEDYNGDGEITSPEDRQYTQDLGPQYYGGLQNVLTYHHLSLRFFFQFAKQKAFNYWYSGTPAGVMANQPTAVMDHWQNLDGNAATQLYTTGLNEEANTAFSRFSNSDAALSDASYIRLKNVSLRYNVPFQGMEFTIFAEGQNLFTLTHYKGGDPEQFNSYLPPVRTISGGVSLQL